MGPFRIIHIDIYSFLDMCKRRSIDISIHVLQM